MPHVMLIAGEPSGDLIGARLMAALAAEAGSEVRFSGVGGAAMAGQGLVSLFPMSELAIMGLAEVLPRIPRLRRRLAQTVNAVREQRPDVLVTIDSPGFNFRLAKRLAGAGVPIVHFVAPAVWAWRPGRAKELARLVDHLLTLLPFEPRYFEPHGLACTFVGHPVVEDDYAEARVNGFRSRHGIAREETLLLVLPGSRAMEVSRHLPIFEQTVARLRLRRPELVTAVSAAPLVAGRVMAAVGRWPGRNLVIMGEGEKRDAFGAADVALAVSGTVTLELGLAGTPTVVAYRANVLTYVIVRCLIRVKYASLVNLLFDREIQPERLQGDCRPDLLAAATEEQLAMPPAADFAELARSLDRMLRVEGVAPSLRAAKAVLGVIDAHSSHRP